MSYDPRYQPPGGGPGGPWAPQPGAYGQPAAEEPAEGALVRLGGWVLALAATALLATVAVVSGGAFYGLATWRRWRWWPLALAGVAGLFLVLAVSSPSGAVERHLLAVRELTEPGRRSLGDLTAARWPAWTLAQVPLALPFGALALARHQVTHVAAHELSPRARLRRDAEDRAQLAAAGRRAASAPGETRGRPVLGAWAGGDLDAWRAGPWCVLPESTLGLGTLLVGLPGAGKTETLLRLAELGLAAGYDVHVIDAKGDATTQARFFALAASAGVHAKLFPGEPYDGFRGDAEALRNRFGRIVDYTEPFYQDGARVLLAAACSTAGGPPRTLDSFLAALEKAPAGVDASVRKGTLSRYRSFAAAVGERLSGEWAYEDIRASYLLLDGLALGDDAPRLARFLVEDFAHYASARKTPGRRALLLIDEFSALRLSNAAALFERLRSFGAGVVVAAQSVEGLHDEPAERARLMNAASTIIAHRLADPDPVVTRGGTVRRAERSHQLDGAGPTGAGSLRIQEAYRVDPNDVRSLPAGVAFVVSAGRAAKVAVARAQAQPGADDTAAEEVAPSLPDEPVEEDPQRQGGDESSAAERDTARCSVIIAGHRRCTKVTKRTNGRHAVRLIDLLGEAPGTVGDVDPVTRRLLDLYLGGLSLERAAAAAGLEVEDASRRLRAEGVAAPSTSSRPAGPPPELLAHLYLRDGLTTAAVGERLGLTPGQARYRLQRAGIRRPGQGRARTKKRLSAAELEDLYVRRQLTIRAIAALVGLDQRDVWRQLTEAGIPRRRRGAAQVALGRETLEALYVDQDLNVEATARRLGVTPRTVRHHLAAHGIPLQDKNRRPPTRRVLQQLYVAERLSPRQIAERLGLTHAQVRYDLVRLGIPRRPGGRPRQAA